MSKPTKSKNREMLDSYGDLVEITDGMRGAAYEMIAANAKVIQDLPTILEDFKTHEVPKKDVDQVLAVARTIATDTDGYSNELKEVDDKFVDIQSKGTKSVRVAAKNYTNVLALSTRYYDITTRLTETTNTLVDDFTDLCMQATGETTDDKPTTEETSSDE